MQKFIYLSYLEIVVIIIGFCRCVGICPTRPLTCTQAAALACAHTVLPSSPELFSRVDPQMVGFPLSAAQAVLIGTFNLVT